jgi:hypothetical protein
VGIETLGQGKGNRFRGASLPAILGVLFLILATTLAAAPQEKKNLTAENIMDLLSGGVEVSRVTYLVLDRGVDFEMSPKMEKAFQDAGADPALLAAIRKGRSPVSPVTSTVPTGTSRAPSKAATPQLPATGLAVHSHPGGVAIYIDGEFKGQTDPQEGMLEIAPLKPGKHHLRATLQGYDDLEGPAEVVAGQLAETPVWMAQTQAPPAPTPASLPAGKKFLVRHVHRAVEGASGPGYCTGWMIVNVGYIRYISTDSPHQYLMNTSEIRDVKASSGTGGLQIKLDFGRKYDFVAVDEKGHEVSAGPLVNEIRYAMGL